MWAQFHEIPPEFWHPNILTSLAKAVSFLVRIDLAMENKDLIMFAHILIEIDCTHPLPAEINVDRDNESVVIGLIIRGYLSFRALWYYWTLGNIVYIRSTLSRKFYSLRFCSRSAL